MSTLVGSKGQITIEKEFRDALGIQPGWRAVQSLEADRIVIAFRPPKHNRSLLGILGGPDVPQLDSKAFQQAVDRAWDEAVGEATTASAES